MINLSIPTNFASVEEQAAESSGIGALGIDPLAILAQAITFLVLFWIIKKFALDKIVATLESRRKTIDDGVRLGLKMEAEQAALEDKIENQLRKTRGEADRIIAEAHTEAGEILKTAQVNATNKVESMIKDAHGRIDEDMQQAKTELKRDIIELVAEVTEAIIDEKLDATKDALLIEKALSGANRS